MRLPHARYYTEADLVTLALAVTADVRLIPEADIWKRALYTAHEGAHVSGVVKHRVGRSEVDLEC